LSIFKKGKDGFSGGPGSSPASGANLCHGKNLISPISGETDRQMYSISAGLDKVPMAWKNIREVMAVQNDLVTVLGEFMPKLVKMAPSGERPDD
jgi:hypothetical protein